MFDNFRNVNYEKNVIINVPFSDANTQDTLEKMPLFYAKFCLQKITLNKG